MRTAKIAAANRPADTGLCVINDPVPVITPTLGTGITTLAIDITTDEDFTVAGAGTFDRLMSAASDTNRETWQAIVGPNVTGGLTGETVTWWFINSQGNSIATGLSVDIPQGRHTFVMVVASSTANWANRRGYMDGIENQSQMRWVNVGSGTKTTARPYSVGAQYNITPIARAQMHRVVFDTVAWTQTEAAAFHAGSTPVTGGTQYEVPCPFT